MRRFAGYLVLALVAFALLPVAVAHAANPKIAVVYAKGKGPNLAGPGKNLVEKPLAASADIVKPKDLQKAAKKAKIKPKDLATPAGAAAVGKEAGLSYVLILEGLKEQVKDGRKKKVVLSAKATLIDVTSGEAVLTETYPFTKKALTKDVAEQIVAAVAAKLTAAPAPAPAEPTPAEPPPPAPPPPAADTQASASTEPPPPPPPAEPPPADSSSTSSTTSSSSTSTTASTSSSGSTQVATADTSSSSGATLTVSESPPPPRASGKVRPGLTLALGGFGFKRDSTIEDSSTLNPLSYGGDPLPAGILRLEFYPLALGGNGAIYEGIGIEAEGIFTRATTEVSTQPKKTVNSLVFGARGGLAFRLVLWDSETAMDIKIRAGYNMFQFPLEASSFPGVGFGAPYAGLTITVPFVKAFGLVVGGSYLPMLAVSDTAKNLGSLNSGYGFNAEAGFRVTLAPLYIGLFGRMDQYTATFKGESSLEGTATYTDASLTDRYFSGYLLAGVEM